MVINIFDVTKMRFRYQYMDNWQILNEASLTEKK